MGRVHKRSAKGQTSCVRRHARVRRSEPQRVATAREQLQRHNHFTSSYGAQEARLWRMRREILGDNRVFHGSIYIPTNRYACRKDAARLRDIQKDIDDGRAAAYWTDGSRLHTGPKAGFLGAGVVTEAVGLKDARYYPLGRFTGDAADAELYAIRAALGQAVMSIEAGARFKTVRIFSDAQDILRSIHDDTICTLGPLTAPPPLALEAVYERAAWLAKRGVVVQLYWVKGHSGSEGNQLADRLAARASHMQESTLTKKDLWHPSNDLSRLMTETDVPTVWQRRGQDYIDEWLWRANKSLLCQDQLHCDELCDIADEVDRWDSSSTSSSEPDSSSSYDDITTLFALQRTILTRAIDIAALKATYASTPGTNPHLLADLSSRESTQRTQQLLLWHRSQALWAQRRVIPDGEWVGDFLLDIVEDLLREAEARMEGDVERQIRGDMARARRRGRVRVGVGEGEGELEGLLCFGKGCEMEIDMVDR